MDIKNKEINIYSKETCKYCTLSKNLLNDINIPFKEFKLDPENCDYIEQRDILFDKYHRSFPIILIDNVFIGGYTELYKLYISGELLDDEYF